MKGTLSGLGTQDSGLIPPIPPWCEWGRGDSAILLVAPHGGRRPLVDATAPPPRLRVNDVYTPEITRALAAVLDAGFVINSGMDRNVLDLNRISRVRKEARWFLELLTREIDRIIQRHGRIELLFVHGWNTGQATCDLGIGARDTPGGLHVPDGAHLTVDAAYRHQRLEPLRAACARAQIRVPIGERYPGSHRNNLLQLFTPRAAQFDHPCARRIAAWVAEGRINALQLELGIPLRWPGRWRSSFVAAVAEAFTSGGSAARSVLDARPERGTQPSARRTAAAALQFYDPAADVGLSAGIGHAGPHGTSGRLLLFLGGQRVALFTGEAVHAHGQRVGPLHMVRRDGEVHLKFSGPMLMLDDAAVYLDLEAALAQSRLVDAEVQIEFAPMCAPSAGDAACFGVTHGHVAIDGHRRDVESSGFANAAAFRAAGARQQTMLAAAFGNGRGLLTRVVEGSSDCAAMHFMHPTPEALRSVRIAVATDGDPYTPQGFELSCEGQPPVRARPLSRMAILRPTGDAGYLRVTFGIARFDWNGDAGYGLYEYARPVTGSDRVISDQ